MKRPLILVTPSTEAAGIELSDPAISVSTKYLQAIQDAGGLPFVLPVTDDTEVLGQAVALADGVLLTGGDDIDPKLHWPEAPSELLATCDCADPARDRSELALLKAVLHRRLPLLAICRGHQLVNIALGGTLFIDLPTQRPSNITHPQFDLRYEPVHDADVAPGTALAAIVGRKRLEINSTHHQAINKLAPPLRANLTAPDGVIEGTELRTEHAGLLPWFIGIQYHPERLYERLPEHSLVFQQFVRACANPQNRNS